MLLANDMIKQQYRYLLLTLLLLTPIAVASEEQVAAPSTSYFASVDGEIISTQEFESAFQAGIRKRFYHGKIPDEQLRAFKQEVSQALISRVLLVQEAKRQGIKADQAEVNIQLAEYEKRYQNSKFWKEQKDSMLKGLRAALEEENILQLLEKDTKQVGLPTDAEAREFYQQNQDLFRTPEKIRVSVIMLKVSPASPAAVWDAAREEAEELIARLKKGADFSELARIHSGDDSANKGGQMGFIHQGMLAEPAQIALDKMQAGDISEPVMSLRGVSIFKLHEKQKPTLNAYEAVAERAKKLLQRDNAKYAWVDLLEQLRSRAAIDINTAALEAAKKS